ncbi:MAG: hypothetical protein ACR650_10450 [Methylocystis sp.]
MPHHKRPRIGRNPMTGTLALIAGRGVVTSKRRLA